MPTPPGYTQTGGTSVPTGQPAIENMGGYQEAAEETFINWQGIVNGTALTPDVTIPPQSFPSSTAFANPAYWPVILVNNASGLPYNSLSIKGQGILIVTGNLIINGGMEWSGIILVGGTVTGNGTNGIYGSIVTGLNTKLGPNAATIATAMGGSTLGLGTKRIIYNSCNIAKALAGFGGLVTYPNTWFDNWASF